MLYPSSASVLAALASKFSEGRDHIIVLFMQAINVTPCSTSLEVFDVAVGK
jgi:hypothetical protein